MLSLKYMFFSRDREVVCIGVCICIGITKYTQTYVHQLIKMMTEKNHQLIKWYKAGWEYVISEICLLSQGPQNTEKIDEEPLVER